LCITPSHHIAGAFIDAIAIRRSQQLFKRQGLDLSSVNILWWICFFTQNNQMWIQKRPELFTRNRLFVIVSVASLKQFWELPFSHKLVFLSQWFLTWDPRPPDGSWNIFEGVASRILCTQLYYTCFIRVLDGGRWVMLDCYHWSPYKICWKPLF